MNKKDWIVANEVLLKDEKEAIEEFEKAIEKCNTLGVGFYVINGMCNNEIRQLNCIPKKRVKQLREIKEKRSSSRQTTCPECLYLQDFPPTP